MKRNEFLKSTFFAGLGAYILSGNKAYSSPAEGEKFRIVHMTDIHVDDTGNSEKGLNQAISSILALSPKPELVITGGDLIRDSLGRTADQAHKQWDMFQAAVGRLNCPVYHTIGNHDILGWYAHSMVPASNPDFGKNLFRERVGNGATWCSFDHKGWHFILLDSIEWDDANGSYIGQISAEQIEWLKKDLLALDKKMPICISTHIPFVCGVEMQENGGNAAWKNSGAVINADVVHSMLAGYNLRMVLQGHIHRDEHIRIENVNYIMSGAVCGAWWRGPNKNTQEGYSVIDFEGESFSHSYKDYGWEV